MISLDCADLGLTSQGRVELGPSRLFRAVSAVSAVAVDAVAVKVVKLKGARVDGFFS